MQAGIKNTIQKLTSFSKQCKRIYWPHVADKFLLIRAMDYLCIAHKAAKKTSCQIHKIKKYINLTLGCYSNPKCILVIEISLQ
jgi:hypothetical protein